MGRVVLLKWWLFSLVYIARPNSSKLDGWGIQFAIFDPKIRNGPFGHCFLGNHSLPAATRQGITQLLARHIFSLFPSKIPSSLSFSHQPSTLSYPSHHIFAVSYFTHTFYLTSIISYPLDLRWLRLSLSSLRSLK